MLPGLGIGILSAFLTALLSTLNKRHVGAGSAEALTFVQIGAGTLFVAVGMLVVEGVEPLRSLPGRDDLALLLVLAVACTLLPCSTSARSRHNSRSTSSPCTPSSSQRCGFAKIANCRWDFTPGCC